MKQSPRRFAPRDAAFINVIASVAKQSGFGLFELLIGIVLFGMLSIGHCKTTST
jgi:prepilin-type N-terminal cleavage/methylation domain-containing protein